MDGSRRGRRVSQRRGEGPHRTWRRDPQRAAPQARKQTRRADAGSGHVGGRRTAVSGSGGLGSRWAGDSVAERHEAEAADGGQNFGLVGVATASQVGWVERRNGARGRRGGATLGEKGKKQRLDRAVIKAARVSEISAFATFATGGG